MHKEGHRYTGPASATHSYQNEFIVVCPECGKEARVINTSGFIPSSGKLTCAACMFTQNAESLRRYRMIVKRNCDNCGKAIHSIIPGQKEITAHITIPCPHCGITRTVEPRNEPYYLAYDTGEGIATDPIFNLPLWLQATVKDHLFWAYNRRHLADIKNYVQAKLRERQSTNFTTMVEKLPQFIKEAKNRNALLKVIGTLEKKVAG